MSKIFYDHHISLTKVEMHIKNAANSTEEKEELWKIVDDIVHHKVITLLLDHLHEDHHVDFLDNFQRFPHDEGLIDFFNKKTGKSFEEVMKSEMENIEKEIIEFLLME